MAGANNVIRAANIMHDSKACNFGANRITISTAGILPKIDKFIDDKLKFNLAISLNASNDKTRDKLMPLNKKWPILDLIKVCKKYHNYRRSKITFEYVLINSINDSIEDAKKLAKLLKNTNCKLNIIPFNDIGNQYKRPSDSTINQFINTLNDYKIVFSI